MSDPSTETTTENNGNTEERSPTGRRKRTDTGKPRGPRKLKAAPAGDLIALASSLTDDGLAAALRSATVEELLDLAGRATRIGEAVRTEATRRKDALGALG